MPLLTANGSSGIAGETTLLPVDDRSLTTICADAPLPTMLQWPGSACDNSRETVMCTHRGLCFRTCAVALSSVHSIRLITAASSRLCTNSSTWRVTSQHWSIATLSELTAEPDVRGYLRSKVTTCAKKDDACGQGLSAALRRQPLLT